MNAEAETGGLQAILLEQRPQLLRYLRARRATPEEAEDLLQDLFVKLAAHPPGPVAEPRAYLYRMAENLLLDRGRAASRRAGREQAWSDTHIAPGDADRQPSVEAALIARERLRTVDGALADLSPRTLFIFRRFRLDGIAQRDIAAELGISLSAVEKHLQKAYRALIEVQAQLAAGDDRPQRQRGEP